MPRLIRIIKLKRVPYGELDEGDEFKRLNGALLEVRGTRTDRGHPRVGHHRGLIRALDTTKYPPESESVNIEGIDIEEWWAAVGEHGSLNLDWFDESQIETRYA